MSKFYKPVRQWLYFSLLKNRQMILSFRRSRVTEWFASVESERIEVKTRRKATVNKTKRNDINGTVRWRGRVSCNTCCFVLNTLKIFLFRYWSNTLKKCHSFEGHSWGSPLLFFLCLHYNPPWALVFCTSSHQAFPSVTRRTQFLNVNLFKPLNTSSLHIYLDVIWISFLCDSTQ
jgi:hypothetical protein